MSENAAIDKKKRRGRPKTFEKSRVLELALKAYWEGNPADVSLNAICKLAEVSKPSLYREFGSEDGLTLAALEDYSDSVLTGVGNILDKDCEFSQSLETLVEFVAKDPVFDAGCLYVKMRAARRQFGPLTQARITEIEAVSAARFLGFLQRNSDNGSWKSDIPIKLAARYLNEQVGLALAQRSTHEDVGTIEDMLRIAFKQFEV
ncbi:MAG: TetR/AcrR family transcriptional regulator [Pseudomonadota bacterium]